MSTIRIYRHSATQSVEIVYSHAAAIDSCIIGVWKLSSCFLAASSKNDACVSKPGFMLSDDGGQQRIFMYCVEELCMCECSSDKRLSLLLISIYMLSVHSLRFTLQWKIKHLSGYPVYTAQSWAKQFVLWFSICLSITQSNGKQWKSKLDLNFSHSLILFIWVKHQQHLNTWIVQFACLGSIILPAENLFQLHASYVCKEDFITWRSEQY